MIFRFLHADTLPADDAAFAATLAAMLPPPMSTRCPALRADYRPFSPLCYAALPKGTDIITRLMTFARGHAAADFRRDCCFRRRCL